MPVDLNSPATTLALLKLNAVIGVTGFFNSDGSMKSLGIQCALCHSTVDQSFTAAGIPAGKIGRRLDGWPNRDLNVGAIVNLSTDLSAPAKLLRVDEATLRKVLLSWGPGKFDAEVFMDGKAFRPDGGTAATLIPPAYGLAGFNLHTWTGWGSVPYWNAFVANLEMHGKGRFADSRLNNAAQFPVAAANGLGNIMVSPAEDRITEKLAALQVYQLAIPAPKMPAEPIQLSGQAGSAGLQRERPNAPGATSRRYLPSPVGMRMRPRMSVWTVSRPIVRRTGSIVRHRSPGLSSHQRGGFYHDGRFASLADVVNHYDGCMSLQLSAEEKSDLIQYLLTL